MSAIQLNRYAGAEHDLTAAGLPEGLDALIVTRALRQRLKNDCPLTACHPLVLQLRGGRLRFTHLPIPSLIYR